MKNMKLPTRPAPSVEEARHKSNKSGKHVNGLYEKKKPPPRPPPPDFTKLCSKSAWNINNQTESLIDWSPPSSPKEKRTFGGSVSSSFSSSTSSLASSKRSLDYDTVSLNQNPWNSNVPFPFQTYGLQAKTVTQQKESSAPPKTVPTIIRTVPAGKKTLFSKNELDLLDLDIPVEAGSPSPPMPKMPPPSPPKEVDEAIVPFGIALYDYTPQHKDDLQLMVEDIVYLVRQVDSAWLWGRVGDKEGMFPSNFIEVQVPLPSDDSVVTALYDFNSPLEEDLALRVGQRVEVLRKVSDDWLYGRSGGKSGQFPVNYVDRVPSIF